MNGYSRDVKNILFDWIGHENRQSNDRNVVDQQPNPFWLMLEMVWTHGQFFSKMECI